MKKKIISIFISALLIFVFAGVACAENLSVEKGENYDNVHNASGCCADSGDTTNNHYNEGYNDGYLDGQNNSSNASQEAIDSAIQSYLNSPEFEGLKQDIYSGAHADGITDYKASDEYESAMNAQYDKGLSLGYDNGYQNAYDEAAIAMYDKGVADGYANFRGTEEYSNTLNANYVGGYERGYTDGHEDGVDYAVDKAYNPATLISLVCALFVFIIIALVISRISFKKGKKK